MNPSRLGYDLESLRDCLAGVGGDATARPPRYRSLHVVGRCASTNQSARQLVLQGAEDGTVVLADEQTAGRGRLGRTWLSPPGLGLYVSVVLRELDLGPRLTLLPLLVGVALADALVAVGATDAALEWPNDVLLDTRPDGSGSRSVGRKVAGVLCEFVPAGDPGTAGAAILGVGVNVAHLLGDFPPELRDAATSLRLALGHDVPREVLLGRFLAALNARVDAFRAPADFPWEAWRARSVLEGRSVRVDAQDGTFEAKALRVAEDGALVVETSSGEERRIVAGDVSLLRTPG